MVANELQKIKNGRVRKQKLLKKRLNVPKPKAQKLYSVQKITVEQKLEKKQT